MTVIVGRGKLAETLLAMLPHSAGYFPEMDLTDCGLLVHVGSGREYEETLALALEGAVPYIQASTPKDFPLTPPKAGTIPWLHAPNLDLTLVKFLYWLKLGKGLFNGCNIQITESHQQEKKSQAGTAVKMCELLGADRGKIVSVRDRERQGEMGIRDLSRHAYHEIRIGSPDSYIRLETNVSGLESYGEGLKVLTGIMGKLENRNYEIEELVEAGFIP